MKGTGETGSPPPLRPRNRRPLAWALTGLAGLLLLIVVLNLTDSPPAAPAAEGPPPANLGAENGFFLLWGFAEPPGTDLQAGGFRAQVAELVSAEPGSRQARALFHDWNKRLNAGSRLHWQGTTLAFPPDPATDVSGHFAARRLELESRLEHFAELQERYRGMLAAARLDDFTPLGGEFPARSLLLATHAARLFAASCALQAVDGRWEEAARGLLQAAATGFRMISGARTLGVNALGKAMVELSLRTLASLLNRASCPPAAVQLVLEGLPPRPAADFGTAAVRAFSGLRFAAAVDRLKRDQIVDPMLLKDYFRDPAAFFVVERFVAISQLRVYQAVHAMASFLVKANETTAAMRALWQEVGRLEETPPWRWGKSPLLGRRSPPVATGPLWWLRNPVGRMMVRSAMPYNFPVLQHYVLQSHELRARYELVCLLARARASTPASRVPAAMLLRLLASAPERDPFGGGPYRYAATRRLLYSLGPDRLDDGGREGVETWRDSDLAVPVSFAADPAASGDGDDGR